MIGTWRLQSFEPPSTAMMSPVIQRAASEARDKLLVAIRGDDGAWAVTDAADGGIADRGGGRGSYRVIDINAGKFCSGHILTPFTLLAVVTRAREGERRQ
jgi:ABC-type branched-subunit amino acid transport system substrate-binding protein